MDLLPTVREFDGRDWLFTKTYRHYLPHWELQGSTYFITACVDLKIGTPFLNQDLALCVEEIILQNHQLTYLLHAYVIMPDHLHLIIKPLPENSLSEIMKAIKGRSAHLLNRYMKRTGKFWQKENFDHLIRHGVDMRDKWDYIRENPVSAKLVERGQDYPFSSFYDPTALAISYMGI